MADSYSKIKAACKFKSRSIDYSDLTSLPHSPRFNAAAAAVSNPNSHDSNKNKTNRQHSRLPEEEEEEEEEEDEYGGVSARAAALSRNNSVSSSVSGFHSAVKRALSMRRSSSVAERYCRIHDQFATLASPIDDDEMEDGDSKEERKIGGSVKKTKKKKKKNSARKIVRACKRLFGI